jgi:hypothetical protein
VQFGSTGERPDSRLAKREAQVAVLVETEDETQVSVAPECEAAVSDADVGKLGSILPALHHAVMIETATAIADRIGDLVDELRMAFGQASRSTPMTCRRSSPCGGNPSPVVAS